ncbi:acyltransferase family protein [Enterobacter ludwigii]|uniref:acyltransferase family protein n=1 Tax=Enterobacter ludwigii TaxID=299767 RepID=UPI003F700CB3
MKERNNSFDLVRHIAAFMVLFSHQYALSGIQEPIYLKWNSLGYIAVVIFFSISGYFMPKSFDRSNNFLDFIIKRCKRIFPGLFACSIFMYIIIGTFFNKNSAYDYLLSGDAIMKIIRNSVFIQEQIPGVFTDFKYRDVINGSLWTLPIEFTCYIFIGFALSISKSWKSPAIILITSIASTIILNYQDDLYAYYSVPFKYLALFSIPFSIGAILSFTEASWWKYRYKMLFISCVMLAATNAKPEIQIIGLICISVLTIVIGLSFKDPIIKGRFDVSYGVYIYAFPIQQIAINIVTSNFYTSLLLSLCMTTLLSIISYRYIELPFLSSRVGKIIKPQIN